MSKPFKRTPADIDFQELKRTESSPVPAGQNEPATLPLSAISIKASLFQPRAINERHLHDLAKAIKSGVTVEPITVWRHGDKVFLLDGHHRYEAYQRAGRIDAIPVAFFSGTPEEALLRSGEANSKTKLPMTSMERQDYGWRLVSLGDFTKKQVMEAASISKGQVDIMRAAKRKLGNLASCFETWSRARQQANGGTDDLGDAEDWKARQADDYADRLAKHFSSRLAKDTEITAMAFAIYFGRKLPELYRALGEHLAEDQRDATEHEDADDHLLGMDF